MLFSTLFNMETIVTPAIVPESAQFLTADRVAPGLPDTVKLLGLGLLGFSIGLLLFLCCVLWLE